MKECDMMIPLLPEYAEGVLPEEMEARIARHLEQCPACRQELQFYEETASFIHSPALPTEYQGVSVSDRVMARILEENKWASPAPKQDVGVSTLRRRIILMLAAVLFVLFMIPVLTGEKGSTPPPSSSSEMAATDRIASSDQFLLPQGSKQSQKVDESSMTYGVIASARNPILYRDVSSESGTSVNYGLLSAIFGILVIVVGMGWLSRLKDKRK
ncbi:anti-sigma factor family protein [Aneurinibacillus uraniidurans]|uniref:anti-sigma factor family protein n=1 Tax=Aneurinibacillus uraniidurans TaxID=2966586 RepID=UPI002349F157|nr:zf-HC2 domain-containing protein [Aneurinibacillus sp. B1]WCN36692.1 zf-HC2 domain-containing protein [Aneurinibacillus sp. B1]